MTNADMIIQRGGWGCGLFVLGFTVALVLWAHERDKQDEANRTKDLVVEPAMPTVGPTVAPLCVDETCEDRAAKAVCSEWVGNMSCKTYTFVYENHCTCHRWE